MDRAFVSVKSFHYFNLKKQTFYEQSWPYMVSIFEIASVLMVFLSIPLIKLPCFTSRNRPSTPHPIWDNHGGFKLYNMTIQNNAQETSISIFNMNSEIQPSAPPTLETNIQPSASVMKLDLPPSYDEVMNKH